MKNKTQNTLVYDFIGTAFCLVMALVLILMFSGCSNDESVRPVGSMGGSTEETRIYALSGRAGDAIPMMLTIQASSDSSIHAKATSNTTPSQKGTIVVVYELDSLTLDKTGRSFADTISNDSGYFAFAELAITSPYVLIQMQDSCYTEYCGERDIWGDPVYKPSKDSTYWMDNSIIWNMYPEDIPSIDSSVKYPHYLHAIVDLRKHSTIRVNSLTNIKAEFLKHYFKEGMSLAEASKKAELLLLEQYGIYEDLGDFEELSDNNELEVLSFLLQFWYTEAPNDLYYLNIFNEIPPKIVSTFSEKIKQYYLNTMKLRAYEIAALAHKEGLGQCTESRENESHSTDDGFLVCHSEKWVLGDSSSKTIEHINGTMVDSRDGKTYKTVTYNWGDVTQTWMAENLNFADTTSLSVDQNLKENLRGRTLCWKNDPSCEMYGRFYAWRAAMNLNSSSIKISSLDYYTTYENPITISDSAFSPIEEQCSSEYPFCPDIELYPHQREDIFCYEVNEDTTHCEPTTYCRADAYVDSIYKYCEKKYEEKEAFYLDYSQFISPSRPVMHQGVCPDGWRIPNVEDWETLFKNIAERFDEERYNVWYYLADSNTTGFGFEIPMAVEVNDTDDPIITFDYLTENNFATVPYINDHQSYESPNDLYPVIYYYTIRKKYLETDNHVFPDMYPLTSYGTSTMIYGFGPLTIPVLVRCIKN
jgi:uncharacterized protein (TIGR02145 family)